MIANPRQDPNCCYVCDLPAEAKHVGHTYWSNADALAEFEAQSRRVVAARIPSMTAAETLDPREAVIA